MTPRSQAGRKHLILIGLPGAGKSTVGPLVAELAGVPFFDVDTEVERITGTSVADIFRDFDEARFRALESAVVKDSLARSGPVVLAPGGGWAAQDGNLQVHVERRICLYLVTSPQIAVARASRGRVRPLLPEGRELSAMEELLMNRERYYAQADGRVVTDGRPPSAVAREVAELARMKGAL